MPPGFMNTVHGHITQIVFDYQCFHTVPDREYALRGADEDHSLSWAHN